MEKRKEYIIIDRRVKTGYYTYALEIYHIVDGEKRLLFSVEYGDLSYRVPNTSKRFDEAMNEIKSFLEELGIPENEVEYYYCGEFQQPCCVIESCDDP